MEKPRAKKKPQKKVKTAVQEEAHPKYAKIPMGKYVVLVSPFQEKTAAKDKAYPDYETSPLGQYLLWVSHLRGVDEGLVAEMKEAQDSAKSARHEEGVAHNQWNQRVEKGMPKPYLRPHDWKARRTWLAAVRQMHEIEVRVASKWSPDDVLAAKEKAVEEMEKQSQQWGEAKYKYPRKK